ncbi:superoxide dismutase [Luteolibacter sp. GHJ8]|uniref:Superoxide dismutase n=1 Tax=Luteolibacter rhizosphaerae TaxID=2989719 RepID=A0ABT3G625_9BACT|nr:superoxide dismutase [Luteolibacter rhizosphaerae]MCW1915296.1 superoxide dismutase [Luteolibacter rhizosphaerae]
MNAPTPDRRSFLKLSIAAGAAAIAPAARAQDAAFSLPKLPYALDALEPHIDAKTMEIHHGKHHAAYIKNLNDAIAANDYLKGKTVEAIVGGLTAVKDEAVRTTLRNNAGGHWNHTFFWEVMAPAGKGGEAGDDLATAIKESFGSLDDLKKAFNEAATKRFGSGWAWLIVQDKKLKVVSTANQDNPLMKEIVPDSDFGTPILGLDVWEHAYYLHYQNKRPDYITAWWNVVNWKEVERRFKTA